MRKTEEIYYDDFGEWLTNEYTFEDNPIQSGSIGQVYKAWSKKRNEYVAIKVKHPDIDEEIEQFVYCVQFITAIVNRFINTSYIGLVQEFIETVQSQLNFVREAKNLMQLKHQFASETCVIIPTVYKYSHNCIIMSFHSGKCLDEISNKRSRIISSMYLQLFTMTSLMIHNFFHCDLHPGNWKVDDTGDDVKIVVYDCGLVVKTQDNTQWMKKIISGKYAELVDEICSGSPIEIEKVKEKVRLFEENPEISGPKKTTMVITTILESKLKVNTNLIVIIQGFAIVASSLSDCISVIGSFTRHAPEAGTPINWFIYEYITRKCGYFSQLHSYYKQALEEETGARDIMENWLQNRYGHRDIEAFVEVVYEAITFS
jgi:serine/threonine protein kinase